MDDEALYREFRSFWKDILKRARRTNIRHGRVAGTASIKYDSPDNMELRRFNFYGDILPGPPMDNIRHFSSVLEESGLIMAGAFAVEKSSPAKTMEGAIYYLTPAQSAPDAEIRLRYLRFPDPDVRIGGSVLEKAGVRVALRQGPGAIFYVGKHLRIYVLKSDSPKKSASQTINYVNLLKARKETYIGSETDIVDNADGVPCYITKVFTHLGSNATR